MADIIRKSGRRFMDRFEKYLSWPQVKVLNAIERCRTAALGGHRDQCDRCGHQAISYNSCRNRHCPKCQTNARDKWLAARRQELLPVDYYHLVFSVPHTLVPLVWQNKKILFKLLFEASAETRLPAFGHIHAHPTSQNQRLQIIRAGLFESVVNATSSTSRAR